MFLPDAFALLSQKTGTYVEGECPECITVSSLLVRASDDPASYTTTRIATIKIFVPPFNRRSFAKLLACLGKCNTSSVDDKHERSILELDSTKSEMIPFGTF